MPRAERRFLGDLDAATDKQFQNHFVESRELTSLLSSRSNIVYGSKGVGKTALRRALTELNRDSFYATKTIDLDRISFSQVHAALSRLNETAKTEVATLARNTWRNVLAMYCLEAIHDALDPGNALAARIRGVLDKEGFEDEDSNERLVGVIDRLFVRIAELATEPAGATPLGLTSAQRKAINAFPAVQSVRLVLEECSALVRKSGKVTLVCLDGFDSIVDHTPDSRRAVFAGLMDAVFKCSNDPLFNDAFCFKAFLPQELTDDAQSVVWDTDKFVHDVHHLRWAEEDFKTLIKKRMAPHARTKSASFAEVWHDIMPDKIRNEAHRIDEPSFNYIIRHTLYRPRQLLAHVQEILDRWDQQTDAHRVDPSFIPKIVASMNEKLARSVVNQLGVKHVGLEMFMKSWSGSPNLVQVAEVRDRVGRMFGLESRRDINSVITDLYNVGIFGCVDKASMAKGSPQIKARFGCVADRFDRNASNAFEDSDLVALSPMFHEYCGCSPSEYGAIMPTAD